MCTTFRGPRFRVFGDHVWTQKWGICNFFGGPVQPFFAICAISARFVSHVCHPETPFWGTCQKTYVLFFDIEIFKTRICPFLDPPNVKRTHFLGICTLRVVRFLGRFRGVCNQCAFCVTNVTTFAIQFFATFLTRKRGYIFREVTPKHGLGGYT